MITNHSSLIQSDLSQSSSNQTDTNQISQDQVNQQIEHSIVEVCSNEKEKDNQNELTNSVNETNTIDLSTSSQQLETLINRKRRTKEKRQIALKRKVDSIKILTLMLSVNEALKNAQKTLYESLKVAKIEHGIVQQLINQI
jgi:NCAIR mutase (PurE)-related protein